jgi:putative YhdH/YhfP family quinone oxidoreductase
MGTDSFRAFEAPPRTVTTLTLDDLPGDGALIEVAWSSVNYKDALAASPTGRVARISPIVPGIDLSGRLVGAADGLPAGAEVVAHGYDIGVSRHGGYAQYARVPAEWLVPLPKGLDLRAAMVIGTAGFTAALSVVALEDHGTSRADGPVLVTGATGGVGSVAVSILAGRGYEVVASTGKASSAGFLRSLGASEVVDRETLSQPGKPLDSMAWAAAVDCVGGTTLANVLSRIRYGGAVAASGLTGGADLPTTVMPFILRGVSLLGIDSVQTPIDRRRAVWERLGADLKPPGLDEIAREIGLADLDGTLATILEGGLTGRTIVDVQR